jgi:cation transport regulator ChaC
MTTDPLSSLQAALAARYTITRELGRGGMATVYLAEDLKHLRKVAIEESHLLSSSGCHAQEAAPAGTGSERLSGGCRGV